MSDELKSCDMRRMSMSDLGCKRTVLRMQPPRYAWAMVSSASLHSIRLFYAAYFAAMGIVLPFFPVYLAGRGMDAAAIGVFTGLLAIAKVLAPPLAGHALDRSPDTSRFILFASLAAAVLALLLPWMETRVMLALAVLGFGCLWAVVLPLTDGLSVAVSEAALVDYGRLRVWGSIGFVVASLAGGIWLAGAQQSQFPYWLAAMLLLTGVAARGFPANTLHPDQASPRQGRFVSSFGLLLLVSFLMQASHGAYYGFYSLYLIKAGYAGWMIGAFWVLGVMAEIVLMWRWSRPIGEAAPSMMLSVCLFLASVRWLGIGLTQVWWMLALLQLLHAASFAAFHVNAVTWVRRFSPPERQASAQSWYSAAGFGLGTALGMMACGWISAQSETFGFQCAFTACAAVALLGIPVALRLQRT